MAVVEANWRQPVNLDSIDTECNVMEDEMRSVDAWPFIILRSKAGFGKTYSPMVWAKKHGYDVFIQECAGDQGQYDLVGSFLLTANGGAAFQAGVLGSALKWAMDGHKTVLIMDEVNLLPAAVIKSVNGAFDFRHALDTPVGRLEANGNLIVVGTCNSERESAGFDLDDSFQSRALTITLKAGDIAERFGKLGKLDEKTVAMIQATDGAFSLREGQQVVALAKVYGFARAMQMVTSKFVNEEKRKLVCNAVIQVWGEEVGRKLVGG